MYREVMGVGEHRTGHMGYLFSDEYNTAVGHLLDQPGYLAKYHDSMWSTFKEIDVGRRVATKISSWLASCRSGISSSERAANSWNTSRWLIHHRLLLTRPSNAKALEPDSPLTLLRDLPIILLGVGSTMLISSVSTALV